MIKQFLLERRSWILLFMVIQGLFLLIAYLDWAIPFLPILYMVFISFLTFVIFLVVRYHKETKFYKSLANWEGDFDLDSIEDATSPFEKVVETSLINQTERQKQNAANNMVHIEREKDELMAWVHEVKTPLTAMQLMFDHIEDFQLKSQLSYEWLRVHLLLDQQLHQKRIHFIENDLLIETIALEPLLNNEIRNLQSWCIQKGIGFDIELQVEEVLSDAKWLSFIIRQILTNAVKYSDAGDILIKSYEMEGHAVLHFEDFGRGIDAKDVPRIFDMGFTTTNERLGKQGAVATGMGLYLAKKAATPLSIHIEVESELGTGTIFTLTFSKKNEFVKTMT